MPRLLGLKKCLKEDFLKSGVDLKETHLSWQINFFSPSKLKFPEIIHQSHKHKFNFGGITMIKRETALYT